LAKVIQFFSVKTNLQAVVPRESAVSRSIFPGSRDQVAGRRPTRDQVAGRRPTRDQVAGRRPTRDQVAGRPKKNLVAALIFLTCFALFTQLSFAIAHFFILKNNLINATLWHNVLPHHLNFFLPWVQWVIVLLAAHGMYTWMIWYFIVSIGHLLRLRQIIIYYLGILLWWIGAVSIVATHTFYFHHSFFTTLIQTHFSLSNVILKIMIFLTAGILLIAGSLTCLDSLKSFSKKRHITAFILLIGLLFITGYRWHASQPQVFSSTKPNIIIIGLDAFRPDFVNDAPHIQQFLKSATMFTKAYTPLARTAPSWASILTAKYPKHNGIRDNNTDLQFVDLQETLPKKLQKINYETIYATDDRRYNNINETFGFDRVLGPPGNINDFIIGTLNDFPLTNLLMMSPAASWLFPYNFANHSAYYTYSPNHFLQVLAEGLHAREHKPLFLAVHFNLSGWPLHWFNDQELSQDDLNLSLYQHAVAKVDEQFGKFYQLLQENHLLDNAIVFVLSDHGITLGLHHDKMISLSYYQGNKKYLKQLRYARYSEASPDSVDFHHDYGIDTSYGYSGDILSMKQNHVLLAVKTHISFPDVTQVVSLLDIAPTLVDILQLPPFIHADGISLLSKNITTREFYFESGITDASIERAELSPGVLLTKLAGLLRVNHRTGVVFVDHTQMEKEYRFSKQHAIRYGNWFLASYPASLAYHLVKTHGNTFTMKSYVIPAYDVLVNLKTNEWTMQRDTLLAKQAPLAEILKKYNRFYKNEIPASSMLA